jgi:hypothetical protein
MTASSAALSQVKRQRQHLSRAMAKSFLTVVVVSAAVMVFGIAQTVSVPLTAQARGAAPVTRTPSGPALRTPWREPDLSGVWAGANLGATPGHDTFNLTELERLYRPEARAKMRQLSEKDDPALRCIPYTFPRAITLSHPFQIIQAPGVVTVLIESMHTFRIIPTDGRQHPGAEVLFPTFHGDSVGHWEADTLVVDVVSSKGETWLADGRAKPTPTSTGAWLTSDALHVVERWRRVDAGTLEYQATIEDPKVLSGRWKTPTVLVKRAPLDQVQEVNECMESKR